MSKHASEEGLILSGLDGTNPLGFLAVLGVLRVLTNGQHRVRLGWKRMNGTWRPELIGSPVSLVQLGNLIHDTIRNLNTSVWLIHKKLPFDAAVFRKHAREAVLVGSHSCREVADDLASFGADCFADKDGAFESTSLCMVRSGDSTGQGLLAYGKRIIETTTTEQLQRALTTVWLNEDDQCALRWDPAEDRPYAVQWRNPSKVGALSEKGANCLALFGMACLPAIPVQTGVETTGFGLKLPKQTSLTWPIWDQPISLSALASLLTLSQLQRTQPDPRELRQMGIVSVYRCNRIMTSTYYANFTPSRKVA